MGNSLGCFSPSAQTRKTGRKSADLPAFRSNSINGSEKFLSSSSKREPFDDALIRQQAIAAALLFRQHQQNGTLLQFDRSLSVTSSSSFPSKKQKKVPRSSSSRPRSLSDSLPQSLHLTNQRIETEGLETRHFVLVHGGGFGAWCWYKTMTLLKECGYEVDAIDLTGSGVDSVDTNSVTTLAQYVKPLIDFLGKLADGEKIILVGHDTGGACVSYAMELYPSKVSKAIFIAAAMLTKDQSILDMVSQQSSASNQIQGAQTFLYAKGKNHPPTAIDLDKLLVQDVLFNQTPAKDVALASVSMRPIPFGPVAEKLTLSEKNYGSIRRFYIKTQHDFALPVSLQEAMINANPPEQVFQLKGSDHSPFFSRPQALHKVLVEISKLPPT